MMASEPPPAPPPHSASRPHAQCAHAQDEPPAPVLVRSLPVRWLLRLMALLCLGMAVLGVLLPGVPTTVFVLMAAWAAMRSSPGLHRWLWRSRLFGHVLRNWSAGGYVGRGAKRSAAVAMAVCAAVLWGVSALPLWARVAASLCMATVLVWLWRRPLPPGQD